MAAPRTGPVPEADRQTVERMLAEQRGHGGGASCIRSGYKRATHEATTRGKRSEDLKAARAWLELAAKQGHAKAKAALSELK